MGIYLVQASVTDGGITLKEGKDTMVVTAQSAAEAKLVAKAQSFHPSDAAWAAATVTAVADAGDLIGWRARITIRTSAGVIVETVTVTAVTTDDFDDIGNDLVVVLYATDSIAGAADSTPALTIAETTDSLGDHTVTLEFLPPITWADPTVNFPAFYESLVHEGAAGAALSCNLIDVATGQVHVKARN